MPKTPQDRFRSEVRRAWLLSMHPAQAGAAGIAATDSHTPTDAGPSTAAAAALIVGGTTFPTMDLTAMSELTTTFATTLISVPTRAKEMSCTRRI
jgi:hypothetical protein